MKRCLRARKNPQRGFGRVLPCVCADARDLNYDKYFIKGEVQTQANEDYTSHNTERLTVDGVVDRLLQLDYIKEELEACGK